MATHKGEIVRIVEELIHEIGFSHTATTIDDDEFRFIGRETALQFSNFALATYQFISTHSRSNFGAKIHNKNDMASKILGYFTKSVILIMVLVRQ